MQNLYLQQRIFPVWYQYFYFSKRSEYLLLPACYTALACKDICRHINSWSMYASQHKSLKINTFDSYCSIERIAKSNYITSPLIIIIIYWLPVIEFWDDFILFLLLLYKVLLSKSTT